MTTTSIRIITGRVGEVEITRVLEFEAALFKPRVIYPEASCEIIERHRTWLEPTLMDPASGLLVFAFHSSSWPCDHFLHHANQGHSTRAASSAFTTCRGALRRLREAGGPGQWSRVH